MKPIRLLLLSIFVSLFACNAPQSQPKAEGPNFIIIYADDLGYGDLSCYGHPQIKTPNLDQMAANGIKFSELYSISPVCSPSRAGLMTGRYPIRMGIHHVFFPESWTGMSPNEITLAEALKENGYSTGVVGKWHLGHHLQFLPLQQGFDEYFGIPYSNDMEAVVYMEGNEVITHDVDQRLTTKTYTEKALNFIEKHQEEPFFLYVPHSMPHVPIYASDQFAGKSPRGLYGDVIEEIDWSVGQILDKLENLGLDENTIVLFSSDNGPWLPFGPDGGSAGILREGKQFTFEGGMRVPGILQWKKHIAPGQEVDEMVSMLDWFPTLLSIAGVKLPQDRAIDGNDISPLLLEGQNLGDRELAYYMAGELRAYRYGDWKVKIPFKGTKDRPWQAGVAAHDTLLFNLKDDPSEKVNLFSENRPKLKEVVSRMNSFVSNLGELPPGLPVKERADNSHYDRRKAWIERMEKSQ